LGVFDVLNEQRIADLAPSGVHATLLDEGRYLCSERTMHRVFAENAKVRERRDQLRHPVLQSARTARHRAEPARTSSMPDVPFHERNEIYRSDGRSSGVH